MNEAIAYLYTEYILKGDAKLPFDFFIFSVGLIFYYSMIIKWHTFYSTKNKIIHIIGAILFASAFELFNTKFLNNYSKEIFNNSNKIYIHVLAISTIFPILYMLIDKKIKIKYLFILGSSTSVLLLGFLYHCIIIDNYMNLRMKNQYSIYEQAFENYSEHEILEFCKANNYSCINSNNVSDIDNVMFSKIPFMQNQIVGTFAYIKENQDKNYRLATKIGTPNDLFFFRWDKDMKKYIILYNNSKFHDINSAHFVTFFSSTIFILMFWFYGFYLLLNFHSKRTKNWKKYKEQI